MTAAGVTRATLEETPVRALEFLFGIGKTPIARTLIAARGYDAAEHKRGWALLESCGARTLELAFTDDEVAKAEAELDQWDEGGIRLIRASFTRHPAQAQFVLKGIVPATGAAAVINVGTLMKRIDEVEESPEGGPAIETLSRRGLTKVERERLKRLVVIAKNGTSPTVTPEQVAAEDAAFENSLVELRQWYNEWAEIARLVIKRRDLLIRLGLAERRANGSDEAEDNGGDSGGSGGAGGGASPSPFLPDGGTK